MDASLIRRSSLGTMAEREEDKESLGSVSSFSSGDDSSTTDSNDSSSDLMDEAASSSSSSLDKEPLFEMSSLMAHLPIKRGLSKHFQGKSQSFTSLPSARCLEDLAKPERFPWRKRMKTSKSFGRGLDGSHKPLPPKVCSKVINKKSASRVSLSSSSSSAVNARKHGFLGSRPPVHPQRSGSENLSFASKAVEKMVL